MNTYWMEGKKCFGKEVYFEIEKTLQKLKNAWL